MSIFAPITLFDAYLRTWKNLSPASTLTDNSTRDERALESSSLLWRRATVARPASITRINRAGRVVSRRAVTMSMLPHPSKK